MKMGRTGLNGREPDWAWPIDIARYDRAAELSPAEREHMGRFVARFDAGGRGWHKEARPALARLLRPLYDTLDYLGATATEKRKYTVRTTVVCLLIRNMHRHDRSFWAFSPEDWHEMLEADYYAYMRRHGPTANARHQLIAVASICCATSTDCTLSGASPATRWPRKCSAPRRSTPSSPR